VAEDPLALDLVDEEDGPRALSDAENFRHFSDAFG